MQVSVAQGHMPLEPLSCLDWAPVRAGPVPPMEEVDSWLSTAACLCWDLRGSLAASPQYLPFH